MHAKFLTLSLPVALALAAAAGPAIAKADKEHQRGVKLSATLSGANEVNAQGAPNQGDPDGTGSFSGRLVPGQGQLCYTLTWSGIDAPTMAHIHSGAAGANGPVFIGFTELATGEHCIAVDEQKATALVAKSQDFYVNIHNPAFPGGAVRGQLVKN
ncbi:CHRD domain-containing protein [Rhizorhabdus argentea]|uniref:CHRD domain-containing protein n=1 Tax=Rhizorhabdus argentea TaxID=1387174 RepID=UPI0030ED0427